MNSIEQVILHYQRDLEKIASRPERALKYEDRLLHCLNKLKKLPVTVNHLQTTGVGKTVNSLRKLQSNKGVNEAAKALVAKWKNMVIEEDEEEEETKEREAKARLEDAERLKKMRREDREYAPESVEDSEVNYRPSQSASLCNSYSPEHLSQNSDSEVASYSPSKKAHVPNGYNPGSPSASSSNGIEVLCYSPSKKSHSKDEKRKRDKSESEASHSKSKSSKTEHRSKGERSESKEEKASSSHHSKSVSKDKESRHKEKKKSSGHSLSTSKEKEKSSSSSTSTVSKSEKKSKSPEKDGIDSMSGASFAQALGPILVKKSSSSSSSPLKKKPRMDAASSSSKSSSIEKSEKIEKKKKIATVTAEHLLDDVAGPSHLAPLDLDVVSTLSVPTPNYRPMPQPPMNALERRQRVQDEEDALARIMSNKNRNARTKVYSGVKGSLTHVPSLYELCCDVLKLHIDSLEFTGGIPYSLLKPVLDGATPSQLYQFEHYNPYMIGDTDHLWKFHCSREFRGETREEMETWRDMYLRCMDEREEKYKSVTANIQESLMKSVPVRKTKLAYVDIAKPPRSVLRKQMKNGTGGPDAEKMMGKGLPGVERIRPPPPKSMERPRVSPIFKPKVAPLMQKTLKSIKQTRFKR